MRKYFIVNCIIISCIILSACKKTDHLVIDDINLPPANITASVAGRVVNEFNEPVSGATVTAGSSSTITDINGQFKVSNANLLDKQAYVKVSKAGYFQGSRTFFAKEGQSHYVEIKLLPRTVIGSINGSTGGTINVGNGTAITIPANGVVIESTGAAYSGSISVAMNWIDPTSPDLNRLMPGDLRGIDEAGTQRGLLSFGMIGVELYSTGGAKLQIASGKKAALKFPIPASLQANAPSTIALWSFNDTTGLWKQEGFATRTGNAYNASVGHFSFWNCDFPYPVVQFSATFKDQNGLPLKWASVKLTRTAPLNGVLVSITSYTDSAGFITGLVPTGEPFTLEVRKWSQCQTIIYSQNIGPFSTSAQANLGVITINMAGQNAFTITGTAVNCNGAPITNGYIQAEADNNIINASITNGSFSLAFPACGNSQVVKYFVMDVGAGKQSDNITTTLSVGSTNVGTITACSVPNDQFINFTYDGASYQIVHPIDSVYGITQSSYGTVYASIGGFKSSNPNTRIEFYFAGNGPGLYPLNGAFIQTPGFNDSLYTVPSLQQLITVPEFGIAGSYISGSFNGIIYTQGNIAHPLSFTFRVRRK